jgi:hypothetical protein
MTGIERSRVAKLTARHQIHLGVILRFLVGLDVLYMYKSMKDFTCTLYKYPRLVQIKGYRDQFTLKNIINRIRG